MHSLPTLIRHLNSLHISFHTFPSVLAAIQAYHGVDWREWHVLRPRRVPLLYDPKTKFELELAFVDSRPLRLPSNSLNAFKVLEGRVSIETPPRFYTTLHSDSWVQEYLVRERVSCIQGYNAVFSRVEVSAVLCARLLLKK